MFKAGQFEDYLSDVIQGVAESSYIYILLRLNFPQKSHKRQPYGKQYFTPKILEDKKGGPRWSLLLQKAWLRSAQAK